MRTRTRALIIGSGIAGPAAALAFAKAGIEPAVFERYPSAADEAGVFFTLGSNGVDALRTLGLRDVVAAQGFATPAIELHSGTGKPLGLSRIGTTRAADTLSEETAPSDGIASRTMRRADLYAVLRDRVVSEGLPICYGKELVSCITAKDGVTAVFADGSTATGDLLVGCDGVHSATRTQIDPRAPGPVDAGLINYGGYTRGVTPDADPGTFTMIFGAQAFFGYAIASNDEIWWFVNEPTGPGERPDLPHRSGDELRRHLRALVADDHGPAADIIARSHDLARPTPTYTLPHLPRWHRGRMVVIGDAAHAPSPSSGQGASLSIEDAIVLARCVRDLGPHTDALQRFEDLRRPRVERIVGAAARVNANKAATGPARRLRDLVLPIVLRLSGTRGIEETYGFHIDWDERVDADPGPRRGMPRHAPSL